MKKSRSAYTLSMVFDRPLHRQTGREGEKDKTRQRQDKTKKRKDKTRQDKTRQDKTRQDKRKGENERVRE